jgi:ABC-type dipeptide/oligopeptide/nickel transport system permease component
MPPIVHYILRRLLAIPITILLITMVMYAIIMVTPASERAKLYFPSQLPPRLSENDILNLTNKVIEEKGLDDPYFIQYGRWLGNVIRGDFGWSSIFHADVWSLLIERTPQTMELTIYSILLLVPLGIISGVISSSKVNKPTDHTFRLFAFIGTSFPPFILGLILLTIFYAGFRLFPPGNLGVSSHLLVNSDAFSSYTGFITIDSLLNGRLDITLEAFQHLFLPVLTLSLAHWATLGRVMRISMLEEYGKKYIIAARARGIPEHFITWRHTMRNALPPSLTSTALAAASLISGVFVVEVVFALNGISELITKAMVWVPDTPLAMGFSVYSIMLVIPLMLILDFIQAVIDPRIREGMRIS